MIFWVSGIYRGKGIHPGNSQRAGFLNTEKSMHPEIHLLKPLILTVVTPIVLLFTTGVIGIFRGKGYPSREFLMSQLIC